MSARIISSIEDVEEGARHLCALCPRMADAYQKTGPLPLRRKPDGFSNLLGTIVSQQVSVASANAIWNRMESAGFTRPDNIMNASDEQLSYTGLSGRKIRYARALAEADIDFVSLREAPPGEVLEKLVSVKGIGFWTAEIYLITGLGHADVFAPGDLALQESARILYDLPRRPRERELRSMAMAWSPWRSVAARLLWAYYRVEKQRDGIG